MENNGLPVAFHFQVNIAGEQGTLFSCSEVSGLEADPAPVAQGGDGGSVRLVPTAARHPNLTLKRGIAGRDGELVRWCKAVLEGGLTQAIETHDLHLTLRNEKGEAVATWAVKNAYPVKWQVGSFDAMKNEMAVEVVEIAYSEISRIS